MKSPQSLASKALYCFITSSALGLTMQAHAATTGIRGATSSANTTLVAPLVNSSVSGAAMSSAPILSFNNLSGIAAMGGTSSGGGDPLALEFKATAQVALRTLQSLMSQSPFSGVSFTRLQGEVNNAQILVSDSGLPVSLDGIIQNGAAENHPKQNLIVLNRKEYSKIGSSAVQQALALHEYLSLMGSESTGNYPISGAYLSAVNGLASSDAGRAISSAANSATSQSCSKPTSDTLTLFSMIADPSTPVSAIQSFLKTHLVAEDALDDQCKTSFDETIDGARVDVLNVLLDHYQPNLSDQFADAGPDSIYGYVLRHSTPAVLRLIKTWAVYHHQKLSLQPAYIDGITELDFAVMNSFVGMFQYVMQNGGSHQVTNVDSHGRNVLMFAAAVNPNVAVIQALIQAGASVNAKDDNGATALMFSARNNTNEAISQTLMQAGANVDALSTEDAFRVTPLILAAGYNKNVAVTQALIQAGANINAADTQGQTALFFAASLNTNEAITQALIQAGADVNATDSQGYGFTTLMYAAESKLENASVVQALIQGGANVNAIDAEGKSALMRVGEVKNYGKADVVQALIQGGASVKSADSLGKTILMRAVSNDAKVDVIQALIKGGANVNAVDGYDNTVLAESMHSDVDLAVIQTLISSGADVNMKSGFGTPLQHAVYPFLVGENYQEPLQDQIIEMLIQAGADDSKDGNLAYEDAVRDGAPASMLKLLKPKARPSNN